MSDSVVTEMELIFLDVTKNLFGLGPETILGSPNTNRSSIVLAILNSEVK
jgi:hypothetical protein